MNKCELDAADFARLVRIGQLSLPLPPMTRPQVVLADGRVLELAGYWDDNQHNEFREYERQELLTRPLEWIAACNVHVHAFLRNYQESMR